MSSEFRRQASLISNVVLSLTVVVLALHKLVRAPAAPAIPINLEQMTKTTPVLTQPPTLSPPADVKSPLDRRHGIIDQLRAMGVPNEVLALVARVDFEAQWESRFEACWGDRVKMDGVQLEMDMSRDAEMRAALGETGFKQWDQKNMLWEAMSTPVDVTESEAGALYDLKKKLQQCELDLEQAKAKGTMDDADINDASDKAQAEFNAQMKALLGDDRYAKSQQLDDAFKADLLRQEVGAVNPSDSQFQELFKAQQQWSNAQLELDPASPNYAAELKTLDDARDQAYRQALGADAFDTLQRAQDPGYSEMKKYASIWGLDDGKIDYVYSAMKNYEKSVQDYQAQNSVLQAEGQNVDWDASNKYLQQLTDQTGQTLQNYLGQDSFNKLQRNHLFLFNQTQTSR